MIHAYNVSTGPRAARDAVCAQQPVQRSVAGRDAGPVEGALFQAARAIRAALRFEDNVNSRFYLGLCLFLAGDHDRAAHTLRGVIDNPALIRRGQVYGAFILGQIAEDSGDADAARDWYARMAEQAPAVLDHLDDEARRHKQTPYGDTLRAHVKQMRHLIAQRPLQQG